MSIKENFSNSNIQARYESHVRKSSEFIQRRIAISTFRGYMMGALIGVSFTYMTKYLIDIHQMVIEQAGPQYNLDQSYPITQDATTFNQLRYVFDNENGDIIKGISKL